MIRLVAGPKAGLTVDDLLSCLSCTMLEGSNEKASRMFTYLAGQVDTLRALGLVSVVDATQEDDADERDDPVRKS